VPGAVRRTLGPEKAEQLVAREAAVAGLGQEGKERKP